MSIIYQFPSIGSVGKVVVGRFTFYGTNVVIDPLLRCPLTIWDKNYYNYTLEIK